MPKWGKILLIPAVISMMILVGVGSAQGEKDKQYNIEQSLVPLCKRCYKTLRYPVSERQTDSLLNEAKAVGDVKAQVVALYLMGEHFYFTRQNEKLKAAYTRLEDYARRTPYTKYIFSLRNRLVALCVYDNDFVGAMKELRGYQRLAFELNDDYGKVYCLRKMGDVYKQQKDYKNAIKCYKEAISGLEPNLKVQRIDDLYMPLAATYMDMQDYDSAEKILMTSYNHLAETKSGGQALSKVLNYLIIIDCRKGRMDSARNRIKLQDRLLQGSPPEASSWDIYYWARSAYYNTNKEYDKCIAACDSVKNESLVRSYRRRAYSGMGDYEKAYQLAERDLVVNDSITQNRIKNQVDLYTLNLRKIDWR